MKTLTSFQKGMAVFILVCLAALGKLLDLADGSGIVLGHFRKLRLLQMTPMVGLILIGAAVFLLAGSEAAQLRLSKWLEGLRGAFAALGAANWALLAILLVAYPFLYISPGWREIERYLPGIWFFALFAALAALCLRGVFRAWPYQTAFLVALTAMGVILSASFYLITISNFPFSLVWSESSQVYFASTYLARSVYGAWTPLPVIQPGYEMLISPLYLFQGLPIWAYRAWLVFLWIGFSLGTGLAMRRALRISGWLPGFLFLGFVFIYLINIPVYFHLLACVFLVFFGFSSRKPAARWAAVMAASIWAGVCRINWFPLPGALAATIYLLETCWDQRGWKYFLQPAAWLAGGTATALLVNAIYMVGSRNPLYYFSSTFTSQLLWYRLLPSANSASGVLVDALVYSIPILGLVSVVLARGKAWHWMRLVGLAAILGVFFLGGIVVSAKIGGGNNIHNLDAFFTLLLVIGAYLYFDRFAPDRPVPGTTRLIPNWAVMALVGLPLVLNLSGKILQPPNPLSNQAAAQAITLIQEYVDRVNQAGGGEILFTSERQLLSLKMVHGVKLIPEYEKWFLMEMAMGQNQTYYAQFDRDIQNHRFALIVSEPLNPRQLTRDEPFAEENNAFVDNVTHVMMANYVQVAAMPEFGYAIYAPK